MSQTGLGVFGFDRCRNLLGSTLSEVLAIFNLETKRPLSHGCEPVKLTCEPKQQQLFGSAAELLRQETAL
jgi:hypothetical protein